jgi:hypothetical protein
MYFIICACLFFALVMPNVTNADIKQVSTMAEIGIFFEGTSSETLAVFDIDNVLLIPKEPAFQLPNMKKYKDIFKKYTKSLSTEELDVFLNLIIQRYPSQLLEPGIPQLIQQLIKQGVRPIALTAVWSDRPGISRRHDDLLRFGVDFSASFPKIPHTEFKDFPKYRGRHPIFDRGIIYANGVQVDKGRVLVDFLKKANLHPKQIIFVDDLRKNLDAIQAALEPLGIAFVGLEYTGSQVFPATPIDSETFEHTIRALTEEAKNTK